MDSLSIENFFLKFLVYVFLYLRVLYSNKRLFYVYYSHLLCSSRHSLQEITSGQSSKERLSPKIGSCFLCAVACPFSVSPSPCILLDAGQSIISLSPSLPFAVSSSRARPYALRHARTHTSTRCILSSFHTFSEQSRKIVSALCDHGPRSGVQSALSKK